MLIKRVVNVTSSKDREMDRITLRFESAKATMKVWFTGCVVTGWEGGNALPTTVKEWIIDKGGVA